jgi:hypothetical protein
VRDFERKTRWPWAEEVGYTVVQGGIAIGEGGEVDREEGWGNYATRIVPARI